ncbi:tetratricopeptide repeat-containing sulfotransferase family protein [Nioella aestuarii]|uniref:tetratricopeptide repeat-containing sulfotransferase family protein n=1 Tax=Nioella aestuarii TaxID=1662864 RepID=UPI003D7F2DAB
MLPVNPARIKQLYQQAMTAQSAGQADEALALYAQVLQARPDLAEAHFQMGRIHAANGDAAKAETALRRALKARPKEPAIWQALAAVLTGGKLKKLQREATAAGIPLSSGPDIAPILRQIEQGQAKAAETAAFALITRFPNAAEPALALGLARKAQGHWAGALGPLQKAVERASDSARANAALGEVFIELGQWLRAEQALTKAADLGADVTSLLARTLRETCRPEDAETLLASTLSRHKKRADLHLDHGDTLAALRRPKEARRAYDKAIHFGAKRSALIDLAEKLELEGDQAAAKVLVDDLLAADPDNIALLTLRGQSRQTAGDLDGAEADFLKALDLGPDAAWAIRSYVAGKKIRPGDPILPILETRLSDLSLPKPSRWVLAFAMAKALEDLGEYDQVFEHLDRANRMMRADYPYRIETDLNAGRALVRGYQALQGQAVPTDCTQDAPIFVSGLPRSGTTLVETVLSAHPRVTAGGEMPFLVRALNLPIEQAEIEGVLPRAAFAAAGHRYVTAARRRSGAGDLFTDKAISTFSRVGQAAIALPNARFLMLRRDPRDVGLSIYLNMFPPGRQIYATDLSDIGRYIRLYDAMQQAWAEALPDRVHVVDYEALTADPDPNIRALVAAAGLDWDPACLEPHKAKRNVATLSFAQVRQPIYRASVAAWKRYETELEPLLEALERPVTL